jgi:hypothetical protein
VVHEDREGEIGWREREREEGEHTCGGGMAHGEDEGARG